MPTFTRIRRMTGVAGLQTFTHGRDKTVSGVTVNGSAATITDANGVTTISSPTILGGEAIVVTETQTPPSVPASTPMVIPNTVSVVFTRNQNGGSSTLTYNVTDEKGANPEFGVTGTTKTNH